ncbi:leucyl aminopeptidase [Sulfurimonas sp. HSL1-2]|uniref:leucyl aminopeptidase n=1 Tax=Thiomicrolovo zhangzhouensis TaxID=3131933 RepID=UPI0031F729A4
MLVKLATQPVESIDAALTVTLLTPETLASHPKKAVLDQAGFEAKEGQTCMLHEGVEYVAAVTAFEPDAVRDAMAAAAKSLSGFGYESAKIAQYGLENAAALVEGIVLGSYKYTRYKSDAKPSKLKTFYVAGTNYDGSAVDPDALKAAVDGAVILATATNFARDLVNTTPDDMTPGQLAVVAQELADANGLGCDIFDEHALEEERMQAMLMVARASAHKPRMIHLSYVPENAVATVSLVGKGLTYDSGGLSLKPATSMVTMKMDKAGACAVLGIMKAVSELQLPVAVHGFVGAVENMIGGNAYKPDDVLFSRNGKTIEVRNTDAEGRLVLADVLSYAQDKVQADYLFDYATLTGACVVALGPYTTGIMGHSSTLKHSLYSAADAAGELVGALPFNPHLKKALKSEIADVSNISNIPYGGAITAAMFLDHFITDEMKEKWMHFDIAGPAYTESGWGVNPHGGTGAGVRTTVAFLRAISEQ